MCNKSKSKRMEEILLTGISFCGKNEGEFQHKIKVKFKFDVKNVKQQQLNAKNRLFNG